MPKVVAAHRLPAALNGTALIKTVNFEFDDFINAPPFSNVGFRVCVWKLPLVRADWPPVG